LDTIDILSTLLELMSISRNQGQFRNKINIRSSIFLLDKTTMDQTREEEWPPDTADTVSCLHELKHYMHKESTE